MRVLPLVLAGLLAGAAQAQDASRPVDGVRATVDALFDGMRDADTTAIRRVLHPDARLLTATGGAGGVAATDLGAFLAAVAAAEVTYDERVGEVEVRVDGGLATAWMPYRFYAGDRFSHCGVNAMQLVRATPPADGPPGGAGWQIVQITDTRRADCE